MDRALVKARGDLADRLRARREEIERAIATRVFAISEPSEIGDPDYVEGLRDALDVALEFAFSAIERGERRAPALPPALPAQARMAARNGVALDIVLRRYLAGYSLLLEYAIEEAASSSLTGSDLQSAIRGQAAVFDRLIDAVSEEHRRESAGLLRSTAEQRAERIRRLLAGEPIDAAELGYELDGFHLGLAASGPDVEDALTELAAAAEARKLTVALPDGRTWAWLGSRRSLTRSGLASLIECAKAMLAPESALAFGEPAEGLEGWRLTHRQALAALSMARGPGTNVVRYADAGLLASVSADDLLLESLQRMYLAPLSEQRDGGEALRETLRVYLASGRNISSAAAALGVNRETVRRRLQAAEERVGQPIDDCAAEMEIALKLDRRRDRPSV
jgi:hypothetical protein